MAWICIYILFSFFMVLTIGRVIVLENRDPAKTLAWLLACIFLPPIALILYFIFGQGYTRKTMFLHTDLNYVLAMKKLKEKYTQEKIERLTEKWSLKQKNMRDLLLQNTTSPFTWDNTVTIYKDGLETFPKMFEAIKKANHHIHVEFYILHDDDLGKKFKQILVEKARQGVKVRILYDFIGSYKLGRRYIKQMQQEGIEILPFFSLKTSLLYKVLNYRNHRKIVVVDGEVGFTGGLNIGNEYIGKDDDLGYWRDTHMELTGESVQILQSIFLLDFICAGGKAFEGESYFPTVQEKAQNSLQIIHSGPDSKWKSILQMYFTMISSAQKSIFIETPYLVPDESILMALRTAALRGVTVKIILPHKHKTDSVFCWYATFSYVRELLEAGIQVYQYNKGFLHAKVCIVDDEIATVGSANMDMRSFFLDFEANVVLYEEKDIEVLKKHFEEDLQNSIEALAESFLKREDKEKYKESLARLFSPLL